MGGACYKSGAQWASKEVEKALKRAGRALETLKDNEAGL